MKYIMDLLVILMIIILAQHCRWTHGARWIHGSPNNNIYDVIQYGAVGDGETDSSQAFMEAWNDACKNTKDSPIMKIPSGSTFLLKPVTFEGPCVAGTIEVQVDGDLIAPKMSPTWDNLEKESWIKFSYVSGLVIHGQGTIDGQGREWWTPDCIKDGDSCARPKALAFHKCDGAQAYGFKIVDTPKGHISINECSNMKLFELSLTAPADSPNTDGIDISNSQNIQIDNTFIGTGDDCIAINGGSSQINITDIACGPGHGISVGSLGRGGAHEIVEEVYVKNCNFTETTNGVRIKTIQGASGYARHISFDQIQLKSVKNPIIIDQHYHESQAAEINYHNSTGANGGDIEVSDITYTNIYGTSKTTDAIILGCSDSTPCTNIMMDQINIELEGEGDQTHASCNNANGQATNTSPPVQCLS